MQYQISGWEITVNIRTCSYIYDVFGANLNFTLDLPVTVSDKCLYAPYYTYFQNIVPNVPQEKMETVIYCEKPSFARNGNVFGLKS